VCLLVCWCLLRFCLLDTRVSSSSFQVSDLRSFLTVIVVFCCPMLLCRRLLYTETDTKRNTLCMYDKIRLCSSF
jgi:hypothetical protein